MGTESPRSWPVDGVLGRSARSLVSPHSVLGSHAIATAVHETTSLADRIRRATVILVCDVCLVTRYNRRRYEILLLGAQR